MESYKKNEAPTFDDKQRALVELEREHGIPKCESISAYRIWFKRNHPGKTKSGKDAAYSPVSFKQAEQMSKESPGDFSCWLHSEKGFLIVTGKDGEPLSPGVQGLYTYSRWCGHRRNVWRSLNSAPKPNNKPLGENNLAKNGKELRAEYSKHNDTYRADFHGVPVAKLSQSFYRDTIDDETPDSYYFESTPPVERKPSPMQAGWIITKNTFPTGGGTLYAFDGELLTADELCNAIA